MSKKMQIHGCQKPDNFVNSVPSVNVNLFSVGTRHRLYVCGAGSQEGFFSGEFARG